MNINRILFILFIVFVVMISCVKQSDSVTDMVDMLPESNVSGQTSFPDEKFPLEVNAGKLRVYDLGIHSIGEKNGEAILIVLPDERTILVDAGSEDTYEILHEKLKIIGLKKIDFLFITHDHDDHVGGVPLLATDYEINAVVSSDKSKDCLSGIQPLEMYCVGAGDVFSDPSGIVVEFLNPEKRIVNRPCDEIRCENNSSLVFRLSYGETSFLFTGDIYSDKEQDLIKKYPQLIDCDILKVPHHGINTSSSIAFLLAVSPKVSLVSSGEPSFSVFTSLQNRGEVYMTGAYGTVLVVSDGHSYSVWTEHEDSSNGMYSFR